MEDENKTAQKKERTKKIQPLALLKLMRPKQWIKNCFVFAAIMFSGNLFNIDLFILTLIAFALFSLSASSVYIINDICDRNKDRAHPKKCNRPIASGAVSIPQAVILLIILIAAVSFFSIKINIWFAAVLLIYFLFNILYSSILKNIAILDIISVSVSYVLRVIAGAVIISVTLSPWIIICTFFVALYISIQKRRGELNTVINDKAHSRKVLSKYNPDMLRDMAVTMGAVTITAYCLYTFQSSVQSPYMIFTIPFAIFALLRYQLLASTTTLGETPENIVIHDMPMVIDLTLWVLSWVIIIYLL